MNYTYKIYNYETPVGISTTILRSDGAGIPVNEANTDYQAFTRWLNDGNIPLPADEGVNNGETNT